jgi:hypothetical protein
VGASGASAGPGYPLVFCPVNRSKGLARKRKNFYPLRCPKTASMLFLGCGFAPQTQEIVDAGFPAGP